MRGDSHAIQIVVAGDFDARLALVAARGLEAAEQAVCENGVGKAIFRDPDGNEIGFGGALR